jgi:anti-sigma factor RsiW
MYENAAGQRLTLYLRHNETGRETAFRFVAQDGANAFYWLDGPLGYALVANLPREQLMPLADIVYRQLERPGTPRKPTF